MGSPVLFRPVVAGGGDVDGAVAVHRHPGWSIFSWWVASMSDQVRAWGKARGRDGVRVLPAAGADRPGRNGQGYRGGGSRHSARTVLGASHHTRCGTGGSMGRMCQRWGRFDGQPELSASGGAISYFDATRALRGRGGPPGPGASEQGAGADPPGRSAKFPAPEDDSGGGRSEEPTRPWWSLALHYGVLVIGVCFVAWMIHRFAKTWRADLTASAPWPARRGFGRGGFGGVPMARKRMVLVEAGHRCAIPTCRHRTTEIAHIVPESQGHDDTFQNLIALCPELPKERNRSAVDPHV